MPSATHSGFKRISALTARSGHDRFAVADAGLLARKTAGAAAWRSAMERRLRGRFGLPEPKAHVLTGTGSLP